MFPNKWEPLEGVFNTVCLRKGLMASLLELPPIQGPGAAQVCFPGSGTRNTWRASSNARGWAPPLEFFWCSRSRVRPKNSQVSGWCCRSCPRCTRWEPHWPEAIAREAIAREEWMMGLAEFICWLWLPSIHSPLWISAPEGKESYLMLQCVERIYSFSLFTAVMDFEAINTKWCPHVLWIISLSSIIVLFFRFLKRLV